MVDSFIIDRKAFEVAKKQLTENAPHSSIALLAQDIKCQMIEESGHTDEIVTGRPCLCEHCKPEVK